MARPWPPPRRPDDGVVDGEIVAERREQADVVPSEDEQQQARSDHVQSAQLELSVRGERPMYDRMVKVPRLHAIVDIDDSLPPVIEELALALSRRYGRCFDHLGANLHRDGADSVAWHGDRRRPRDADPTAGRRARDRHRPYLCATALRLPYPLDRHSRQHHAAESRHSGLALRASMR